MPARCVHPPRSDACRDCRLPRDCSAMNRLQSLLLLLLALHAISVQQQQQQSQPACLPGCLCVNASSATLQVACDSAGFTTFPRPLPATTTTLDLSNNNIRVLTIASLSPLSALNSLKMTGSHLEIVEDRAFSSMLRLQTLDLSANRLRYFGELTLYGARALQYLVLTDNMLESIDGAFDSLAELSRLDLSNNQLTRLSPFSFRYLTNLRYLILSGNRIRFIDRDTFAPLERLMYLVLRGNELEQPLQLTFTSYVLSYVDFSECQLQTPPRGLPNSVRYLQLRRNNITAIHRKAFADCPYVTILVLDDNKIERIDERTFEHMPYLQQLWLNANRLRTPPATLPVSLQRLLLDSNFISVLRNVFPAGSQLTTLSLMGNNLTSLALGSLRRLSRLRSLDLSDNNIRLLRKNTFVSNGQLQWLQLSKNPLRYLQSGCFQGLRSLQTLSIAYIPGTTSMKLDIFDPLTSLHKLDIDSSPSLSSILLNSILMRSSLSSLKELNVQNNDLTTLSVVLRDWLSQLESLKISSSLWYCDVQLRWFRDWLLSTTVIVDEKESIVCFEPRHLYQRQIILLGDDEFVPTVPSTTVSATMSASVDDYFLNYDEQDENWDNENDGSALGETVDVNDSPNDNATILQTKYPNFDEFFTDNLLIHDKVNSKLFPTKSLPMTTLSFLKYLTRKPSINSHSTLSNISTSNSKVSTFTPSSIHSSVNKLSNLPQSSQLATLINKINSVPSTATSFSKLLPTSLQSTLRYTSTASTRIDDSILKVPSSTVPMSAGVDSAHRLGTAVSPASHPEYGINANIEQVQRSKTASSKSSSINTSVTIAVIVTTLVTVVVAIVLVIVIVCLVRKQAAANDASQLTSQQMPSSYRTKNEGHQNGVRFSAKKEVVYFMPQKTIENGTLYHIENNHNDSLVDYTDEASSDQENSLPEGIKLIPGRDINHEGPLRVYKWEEF